MTITTMTSREFNQWVSRAKKAAMNGPVFITDRGKPAHVVLTFEEYKKITGYCSLADALEVDGLEDIEFEPPKLNIGLKPATFDD